MSHKRQPTLQEINEIMVVRSKIAMYSSHNEGKSIIPEFLRILKNFSMKNICIDKLNDIVNKYNNTHHKTIKMEPVDVESSFRKEDFRKFW